MNQNHIQLVMPDAFKCSKGYEMKELYIREFLKGQYPGYYVIKTKYQPIIKKHYLVKYHPADPYSGIVIKNIAFEKMLSVLKDLEIPSNQELVWSYISNIIYFKLFLEAQNEKCD